MIGDGHGERNGVDEIRTMILSGWCLLSIAPEGMLGCVSGFEFDSVAHLQQIGVGKFIDLRWRRRSGVSEMTEKKPGSRCGAFSVFQGVF